MKVLILGGFLGSGKTTLLLQMAHFMVEQSKGGGACKVVVLENEVGKEGIDDKILRGGGFAVENLFNGCACCTLSGELSEAAGRIQKEFSPDWLVVETTGLAYPGLIQDNLRNGMGITSRICTVTDASRWARFRKPMESLLIGQVERADVVLLNKTDLVEEDALNSMEADVRAMNEKAVFIRTSAAGPVDNSVWKQVLGVEGYD